MMFRLFIRYKNNQRPGYAKVRLEKGYDDDRQTNFDWFGGQLDNYLTFLCHNGKRWNEIDRGERRSEIDDA